MFSLEGPGHGVTSSGGQGTGGSYGGEGGAGGVVNSPSSGYGSLVTPSEFGSSGGDSASGEKGMHCLTCTDVFL